MFWIKYKQNQLNYKNFTNTHKYSGEKNMPFKIESLKIIITNSISTNSPPDWKLFSGIVPRKIVHAKASQNKIHHI